MTWHETTADGAVQGETLVELEEGLSLHLFYAVSEKSDADEMVRIAETLRLVR